MPMVLNLWHPPYNHHNERVVRQFCPTRFIRRHDATPSPHSSAADKRQAFMTCILRAGGSNFDVEGFMAQSSLEADSLWRKGEKRFPNSAHSDEINQSSGIRIVASEADFSRFSQQIQDVISFLRRNRDQVKSLASFPGVEGAVLDFGAAIYPPGWSSFTFPPELLALAGEAGISICLSVYPTDNEEETDA